MAFNSYPYPWNFDYEVKSLCSGFVNDFDIPESKEAILRAINEMFPPGITLCETEMWIDWEIVDTDNLEEVHDIIDEYVKLVDWSEYLVEKDSEASHPGHSLSTERARELIDQAEQIERLKLKWEHISTLHEYYDQGLTYVRAVYFLAEDYCKITVKYRTVKYRSALPAKTYKKTTEIICNIDDVPDINTEMFLEAWQGDYQVDTDYCIATITKFLQSINDMYYEWCARNLVKILHADYDALEREVEKKTQELQDEENQVIRLQELKNKFTVELSKSKENKEKVWGLLPRHA